MTNIINIGKKREVFWDNFLLDESATTAPLTLMHPVQKQICFSMDQGWEKKHGIGYLNIVKTDSEYRMYYNVRVKEEEKVHSYLALLTSTDGINWTRPSLDVCPRPELEINNALVDNLLTDGFVFLDPNPACPPNEKYKMICPAPPVREDAEYDSCLWCYTSPDGIHFKSSHLMSDIGTFDTQNTVWWRDGRYVCYIRDFHGWPGGKDRVYGIRDVRVMYSEDFREWTVPEQIKYSDDKDYQVYTNGTMIYERAPHISIGLPVRYIDRKVWTANNEQMGAHVIKKAAMEEEARLGIAVTDTIFMHSRDTLHWHRYNEAFLTPGYETERNWVYGDCEIVHGLVDSGGENYYLYTPTNHSSRGYPKEIMCSVIRKDGFACISAGGEEKVALTKPLVFEGSELHLNFSTSAFGYIYVDITDKDGNPLYDKSSFEIYGDSIDRTIYFEDDSDFSAYSGKEIRLRFRMYDAKLYSMWFK